jgi:hypothetical protein
MFSGYFITTLKGTTPTCFDQFHPWKLRLSTGAEYSATNQNGGLVRIILLPQIFQSICFSTIQSIMVDQEESNLRLTGSYPIIPASDLLSYFRSRPKVVPHSDWPIEICETILPVCIQKRLSS